MKSSPKRGKFFHCS